MPDLLEMCPRSMSWESERRATADINVEIVEKRHGDAEGGIQKGCTAEGHGGISSGVYL